MNTPDKNKKAQQENDFPGYPAYPASEDVTNKNDRETFGKTNDPDMNEDKGSSVQQRADKVPPARNSDDDNDPATDVSPEEVEMLSAADQGRDLDDPDNEEALLDTVDEDGDPLNEPHGSYGNTGADLDVPGSENDDAEEDIGEEDEENNYYTLGGDNHENLEEDPSI